MPHTHDFFTKLAKIVNTGKSRSILLSGNVYDLFFDGEAWVPLLDFLNKKCAVKTNGDTKGVTRVIYAVNRPVTVEAGGSLAEDWNEFKGVGLPSDKNDFANLCALTQENPTFALEFLRQLTICSRKNKGSNNLLILIEGVEMLLPPGNFAHMQFPDRKRIAILRDWFSDPKFVNGQDTVIMLSEARSMVHPMITKLPQLLPVEIPAPNVQDRQAFAEFSGKKENNYAAMTAGLSIQAYRQLLCDDVIEPVSVVEKVEEYIKAKLGDDVVEFKKPTHKLKDVRGFKTLKDFLKDEMIPRFLATGEESLPGAAIAGPIGGGKTFIMEAFASELNMPVLVLKNIRSKWFGETDSIVESLLSVIESLGKVCIFMDEADTVLGGLGSDTHETERRSTGKFQTAMSNPRLRGIAYWLLMTARIHKLSADIRRPGRVGDLIIPILDPMDNEDVMEFVTWVAEATREYKNGMNLDGLRIATSGYSAAAFSALRSKIKAKKCSISEAVRVAADTIEADIAEVRRYQTLQALVNCTSRTLIPKSMLGAGEDWNKKRSDWKDEIRKLEREGIS